MMIQQKNTAKKIAGIIFILASILTAAAYCCAKMRWLSPTFMYTTFFPAGIYGFIGLSVALFLEKRMIAAVFSVISAVHTLIACVKEANYYKQYHVTTTPDTYLLWAAVVVVFVFLALAMVFPQHGYKLGMISEAGVALTIVRWMIRIFQNIGQAKISAQYGNKVSPVFPAFTALLLSAAIMIALWNLLIVFAEDMPKKKAAPQLAAQTTLVGEATEVAEKLLQLKELLDLGIITQDEFDSKKKELL